MKICFVGSADGIISVPFVLSALIMFTSVFILLFVLRDIIDSLLDSTVLEIRYASVSGCDKYSHLYFKKWRRKYYCKAAVAVFLSAAAIVATCSYMLAKI